MLMISQDVVTEVDCGNISYGQHILRSRLYKDGHGICAALNRIYSLCSDVSRDNSATDFKLKYTRTFIQQEDAAFHLNQFASQ